MSTASPYANDFDPALIFWRDGRTATPPVGVEVPALFNGKPCVGLVRGEGNALEWRFAFADPADNGTMTVFMVQNRRQTRLLWADNSQALITDQPRGPAS